MVVCFSCTPETKAQLDRLVTAGHYADHSQAIAAAIQNLTVILSELDEKEGASIVIDRDPFSTASGVEGAPSSVMPGQTPVASSSKQTSGSPSASEQTSSSPAIPALFQRHTEIIPPSQFAGVDIERIRSGKRASVDWWMFGQNNRLLPAKITCRALISLSTEGDGRQPLEKLATAIANEAAHFGQYLSVLDSKRRLGRDDAMAVAFPKHATEFKSIQRFANQFVASANKEGRLSGLVVSLRLIGRNPEYPNGVALTEAGWNFGMMENPVLDGIAGTKTEKFSDDEINFLLDHIVASVPIEALAYRTILNEVAKGALTPYDLDSALSKLPGHPKKVQAQFVSTQRSGAICRMADLDLIGRSRTGTRVSYVLSPRGQDFLRSARLAALEAPGSARA